MGFKPGWLNEQIKRASDEVSLWPVWQQEALLDKQFTPQERYEKTKLRIELLEREIKNEKANLDKMLTDILK